LVRTYIEENFEKLVDTEVAKYGALSHLLRPDLLRKLLLEQKDLLPVLYRLLEPAALKHVAPAIENILNATVGLCCLSEVSDSLLMWGHYTESHRGYVLGFDSESPFFSQRRSEEDEFGFLRRVEYTAERPNVVLSDTSSGEWFQTKAKSWEYEREWRLLRVLSEADSRIDQAPFPICLFDFPQASVQQVIIGIRSSPVLVSEVRSLISGFPNAVLRVAREDAGYGLVVEDFA
jgi:Protein of unknown function (DUF2971)